MPLAFIGSTEIFWIILLGLMLFGGKLPDVAREMGKMFFKARRSINEIRRESGIEDALRDIERESYHLKKATTDVNQEVQKAASIPDWRQAVDHATGPGSAEATEEASTEVEAEIGSQPPKEADSDGQKHGDIPSTETDSQQSVEKGPGNP